MSTSKTPKRQYSRSSDSAGGNVAELMKSYELSRLLECPVCLEISFPPISSCSKGHSVCQKCVPSVKKLCPLCSSPFLDGRNYFMESVVALTKFNCNYKSSGCTMKILGDKFEAHLKSCPYRSKKVKESSDGSNPTTSMAQRLRPRASTTPNSPLRSRATGRPNANQAGTRSSDGLRRIGGCCQWVPSSANDEIPQDAVDGGIKDGSRLYVARAKHTSGCFPGQLHSESRSVSFPWGGRERIKNEYEVLVAAPQSVMWANCVCGNLPQNAVIGGRSNTGETLYIGRISYNRTMSVGWFLPSKKELKTVSNGKEFTTECSQILVKTPYGITQDRLDQQ